jgi:diacylglycerol kinase (ATP)
MESPFKGKTGLARIWQATLNSLDGFKLAFKHESAFRQEVLLACILIPLALWLTSNSIERVLLIGSVLLLMIVELLNSSVEAAIDRIGLERHDLSKRAKDIGSAAVFVALALVALTWGLILL